MKGDYSIIPVPLGQLEHYSEREGKRGVVEAGFTIVSWFHAILANIPFVTGKL